MTSIAIFLNALLFLGTATVVCLAFIGCMAMVIHAVVSLSNVEGDEDDDS